MTRGFDRRTRLDGRSLQTCDPREALYELRNVFVRRGAAGGGVFAHRAPKGNLNGLDLLKGVVYTGV